MRTLARLIAAPLLLSTAFAVPARAEEQQHIVDRVQLMRTTEQQAAIRDADRAAVREALARPEVQQMTQRLGVDIQRFTASVDVMDGSDLESASAAARRLNEALVGGASNVTISTTTIIIVLLVVILIIVAVK
jgi:hypothetical protein